MSHDKYKKNEEDKRPSNGTARTPEEQPPERQPPEGQKKEAKAIKDVLLIAGKIKDWESRSDTRPLKREITSNRLFGVQGDTFLLHLIMAEKPTLRERPYSLWTDEPTKLSFGPRANGDCRGIGERLLRWMLKDQDLWKVFTREPPQTGGVERRLEKKPIHLAVEEHNWSFLACFFGICYDPNLGDLRTKINAVLEDKDENSEDRNCIHHAIDYEIPFSPFLVAVCPVTVLKQTDRKGYTPMHIALRKPKKPKDSIPDCPRSAENDDASGWDDVFSPPRILEKIKGRKNDGPKEKLLETILITTNKDGRSPFQEVLEQCKPINQPTAENLDFLSQFKQLIFDNVEKISDVSTALYGTKGDVKELCLDMSDFNQSSHNFETFVDKLTQLDANSPEKDPVFQFEDTLFFVNLPDLNYVKQPCPHHATRRLFDWLSDKKVRKIKKLSIPDSTTNPLSEAFVEQYILNVFDIEELDWRKLDVNLDIITGTEDRRRIARQNKKSVSDTWKCLKNLTLYSSGNWSALYHWISEDGLAKLPELSTVRINIVHLNQAEGLYDDATNDRHLSLANEYKGRLDREKESKKKEYKESKDVNFRYRLDVKPDALWDYPPPPHDPGESTTRMLKHQFTSQLLPSLNALGEWEKQNVDLDEWDDSDEEGEEISPEGSLEATKKVRKQHIARFQRFALDPQRTSTRPDRIDQRIKVAIIDNGADRIRSKFRHMIVKGQSYVTADLLGSDRSLPWWMVSDPHGTQMASLIGQTNDFCRLYIARVGKGRNDINPEKAAKAIDWAVEQKVDIISISWTLKQENTKLKTAIENAAAKSTLIFCSTPDQGAYSEAWPVGWKKHILSVSATDDLGHLTSKTKGTDPVDIQIPGENVQAAGPAYIGNLTDTVSGSSVATALAAGVASLALLMLRTFNPELGVAGRYDGDREAMQEFYTRDGIMRVFRKMGADKNTALKLSALFPDDTTDELKTLEMLAKNWNVNNFPEPPPKEQQEV